MIQFHSLFFYFSFILDNHCVHIFYFFSDSVLGVCLSVYPFLLSCLFYWCIVVDSKSLMMLCYLFDVTSLLILILLI